MHHWIRILIKATSGYRKLRTPVLAPIPTPDLTWKCLSRASSDGDAERFHWAIEPVHINNIHLPTYSRPS